MGSIQKLNRKHLLFITCIQGTINTQYIFSKLASMLFVVIHGCFSLDANR